MFAVQMNPEADEAEFREVAKACLAKKMPPSNLLFSSNDTSFIPPLPLDDADMTLSVPRAYMELLRDAICHSAEDRFAVLYDVLWRTVHGERDLSERASDKAVARLIDYRHAVRRDIHKMHAFLRFTERRVEGRVLFTAWFEPHHHILKRAIPFFVDRFSSMDFLIATPRGTAIWEAGKLSFGPPAPKPDDAGSDSVLDELWLTYYRTTFNPARLGLKTMTSHMPRHYWNNMAETKIIPEMVRRSHQRVSGMLDMDADQPELFASKIASRRQITPAEEQHAEGSLSAMHRDAQTCTRCPLYKNATQTVFGEGPRDAPVVFVGEQPGDQEDLAGKPFVGPAGRLFDRALEEAGLDRSKAYVTNAVKHFKFEPRGKRRIHKKPDAGEVQTCRWWLEGELSAIQPHLVVALGGTAALALASRPVPVTKLRGPFDFPAYRGFITVHPSFLLRLPDEASKEREYRAFLYDLKRIGELAPAIRAGRS
ncbi:MAG: UdgX family uracil-DNA binding protein [Pseudorhodoplanes sp.]